jgi:hypothetical protein
LQLSYSQQEQEIIKEQNTISNESNQNKTSAVAINNTVQGILIVTSKVNNEGGGSSKPSDFIIKMTVITHQLVHSLETHQVRL